MHNYGVLEQADITDAEHCTAEDQLWTFLNATQLADRLPSLFKPGTNGELADCVFILTDRKALDTNIQEDIEKVNVRLYRSGAGGR